MTPTLALRILGYPTPPSVNKTLSHSELRVSVSSKMPVLRSQQHSALTKIGLQQTGIGLEFQLGQSSEPVYQSVVEELILVAW